MNLCLFVAAAGALAQPPSPDTRPVFEVASIKPATIGGVRGGCHGSDTIVAQTEEAPPPLGRCVIDGARLSHLIAIAYEVKAMNDIHNAPVWAISGTERFDIEAKAESPKATEAELKQMLQRLLEDRFQLKYRWDTKEISGMALVRGKEPLKLHPAASDRRGLTFGSGGKAPNTGPVHIVANRAAIKDLANFLTNFEPDPYQDATGLTGEYDFELSWDDSSGPTLSTALRQQLGLRLEPRKIHVAYFDFVSAEHPSAN